MDIELKGMQALLDKLQSARVAMAGPEMRKALRAGGKVIQAAMEDHAPMLKEHQPGSNQLPSGALKMGMRTQVPTSSEPLMAIVGPDSEVEYVARFVEYGHRNVSGGYSKLAGKGSSTRGPGKANGETPAHPFLRPAFEASVGAAAEALAKSLGESFQEVLG